MDSHRQTLLEQNSQGPQNLSYKCGNNFEKEKQVGNDGNEPRPEFPIYCMSDSGGRLHFSLSIYPESTLNPSEQQNLGRQLPECIRDHFERYRRDKQVQVSEISVGASEHHGPLLETLYDNFIGQYPTFSLSYQTYIRALNHLPSLRKNASPSPSAHGAPQDGVPVHSISQGKSHQMPFLHANSSNNSSASNIIGSRKREIECMDTVSEKYDQKETSFFNQLNICRKKDNVPSSNDSLAKNTVTSSEHHHSVLHESPHPSYISSNASKKKRQSMRDLYLCSLPSKCSCPSKKCPLTFSEEERQQICKKFWCVRNAHGNLGWMGASMQGHFLYHPKSRSKSSKPNHFFIGKYFLHKATCGRQEVCRHFFLTTLGLHFFFPLYDSIRQRIRQNIQANAVSSSHSNSSKRKSKRSSILKHAMKKHVRKHFYGRFYHKKNAPSSIIPQAKKSFMHFSTQYPHLLVKRSFEKYLAITCKILKSKSQQARVSTQSFSCIQTHKDGSKRHNNHSSKSGPVPEQSNSGAYSAVGPVMKIKPEDIDEVIADDIEKKYKASTSTSYADGHADNNVPVTPEEGGALNTNLSFSQLYPESCTAKKAVRKPYTKLRKNDSQKKNSKTPKKNPSRKGSPPTTPKPKKTYKISVNEIEDDQSKHPILPACNCIKSKCVARVCEEQRRIIHSDFWSLDNISRRAWMVKHVHILKPKSRSNRAAARLHKMHRKFFLSDSNGQLQDVCKTFFLATLGFKGVGVLRPQKIPGIRNSSPQKESRKRVLSYQVCQQDVLSIIEYCKYFNKEKNVSFCGDERFTRPTKVSGDDSSIDIFQQKISVPYGFTWKELYRDFCAKYSSVEFGYQTFRSILGLVEQKNFSEDILDKFQSFISSGESGSLQSDVQQSAETELSSTNYQDQYDLLQSFPIVQKPPKKITTNDKIPVPKEVVVRKETKKKVPKLRKKLKLSKSFLSPDSQEATKSYETRNTRSSRYNFRSTVPQVSYAIEPATQYDDDDDEDFYVDNWEDSGNDIIKEEIPSDHEKSKKVVKKKTSKKLGRPLKKIGKTNKKIRNVRVVKATVVDQPKPVDSDDGDTKLTTVLSRKAAGGKRGRKRSWKLKINTKQEESTIRLKNRHPILPPCKCNYRKCHERIPQAQREKIHSLYWGISSKQERCKWVLEHIQRCCPKTRSNTGLPSRKRETRRYFFPNEENEIIEVCRVFFLRTLGYQWDSVVDTVSRTLPRPGGYLAKSLGFSEEQLPYEVITQIKTYLKRKKIKKSTVSAGHFPDNFSDGENESNEEESVNIMGHSVKELYTEFIESHPDHMLDFQAFKRIMHFILVPSSEFQTELEIKQEQMQNASGDPGSQNYLGGGGGPENTSGADGSGQDSSVVYFTPEFEKIDIEKALTRKAKRRRPISSRNSKDQHPMREPCTCVRKCREKIEQRKREEIHEEYWALITYNQRKQWILDHIKREVPKRRTNLTGPLKKMETRKFYLEDLSGKRIEICKGFFLATLGFKWDKMIDTICKTTPRNGQYVRPDQRGRKPPSHKLSETLIASVTNYVDSILETASCAYPRTVNRANGKPKKNPDRMPYGLTMKNLFENYKIKHSNHKVGYESFRKIYRSVLHSEKFQHARSSPPQVQDEDDEPAMDDLNEPAQLMPNVPVPQTSIERSSNERASEQEVPSFETMHQSCMFKNQTGMRLHNPDQAHLGSYQRQCEPSVMKTFSEGLNSFPKPHDVQFYSPTLEQNEEMSMQMYKSICLPPTNPNQSYPFYPNNLPLESFPMSTAPQGLHSSLPYSDSLRHTELMHHHHYQPAHHHFGQGRFHGFVLPGSSASAKEPDLSHHQHAEMNVSHGYRNEFECNPYAGKNPLVYPPAYHNAESMPSSSTQRHSFNNVPMQTHSMHEIRVRDSAVATTSTNLLINDSSSSSTCHIPSTIPASSTHPPSGNGWATHLTSPTNNKEPNHIQVDSERKNSSGGKRPKGRPAKKQPKEKVPKVKKEKKVRPKSNRNTREFNPMLPPCKCSAKKCLEKIPEPRREVIYNFFWDLGTYNTRKQWIAQHIVREDPKRRTSLDNPLRRMETRRFFLPNEADEKMEVCKGFFLRTLGFKWDKMVDTICKTTEKGQTTVRPDMRGRKGPSHKLKPEVASSVESYVRSILQAAKPSYDAGVNQSEEQLGKNHDKDIFVPYGLTMKNFHEDYKGKHAQHKVGYESFRKIFRRVSKEVLESVSIQEDEKGSYMPTSAKEGADVVNPVTGLPQDAP